METGNNDLFYKFKWVYNIIKNGLFWHGVRNTLARAGLDFMPYFWEIGLIDIECPQIRDNVSKYHLYTLGEEEITFIKNNIIGIAHKDLMSDLKNGDTCLCLKYENKIAVYSFIKHRNFSFRGRTFELKPNEGYVHNTYTFENFRGKNLAPHLRYRCYNYLIPKGINTYYSISEYYNKPTLRYKEKLNIRPLKLFLSIIIFKRWKFNFTLKSY